MKSFTDLIEITERLLGPGGCPWDQEQTLQSLRDSPIEEACELKEAIEVEDNPHIMEELGDLFFNAYFLSRLAEKEGRFKVSDVLDDLNAKLIRRHPHVFGEVKINDSHSVKEQWERIKQSEKGKHHRKSALDSIPKGLPVVSRLQKVLKKVKKAGYKYKIDKKKNDYDVGDKLLSLMIEAEEHGVDFERALRDKLKELEVDFRAYETNRK